MTSPNKAFNHEKSLYIYIALFTYITIILLIAMLMPCKRYEITECLINYSFGFVKRGLLGSLVINLFNPTIALMTIFIISKLSAAALLVIYLHFVAKHKAEILLVYVVFTSPLLIIFLFNNYQTICKIDSFCILVTIGNALLVRNYFVSAKANDNKKHANRLIIYTVLFAAIPTIAIPILLLIHEGALLFCTPINFIITYIFIRNVFTRKRFPYCLIMSLILYLPTVSVFLLVSLSGGVDHTNSILLFYQIKSFYLDADYTPLGFLSNGIAQNFSSTFDWAINRIGWHVYFFVSGVAISVITVSAISRSYLLRHGFAAIEFITRGVIWFYVLPLFCISPLFIIGIDWGRWLFLPTIQFAFVYLILIESNVYNLLSFPLPAVTTKINSAFIRLCKIRLFSKDGLFVACLFFLLSVPYFCNISKEASFENALEIFVAPFLILIIKAAAFGW